MISRRVAVGFVLAVGAAGCNSAPHETNGVMSMPASALPGHASLAQDDTPKLAPRLVPPEAYIRTYLSLFGGLLPLDAQTALRGTGGSLFDTWDDYLSALGLPDYRNEIPRSQQTNTIMLAAFERVGIALCDRSMEHDRGITTGQLIFTFDMPTSLDATGFTTRFDQLHRTFLGYPVALAPTDRATRYFNLYQQIVANHHMHGAPTAFTPEQAGWANVCYGMIRHPEFHLY